MITRVKKIGVQMLLICMLTVFLPMYTLIAFAADGKITFTDLNVTVGEEFSIRVKIAADSGSIARSEMILAYDSSILEFVNGSDAQGGAGTISLSGTAGQSETQVYTLKFKALQSGTTKITVNSQEVYDADENVMNITHTGSSAIQVSAPATYSKDASLKSLQVSPGTLTPAFSADVTSYSVEVGMDTEQLIVNAVTNSANAKTSLSGTSLTAEENTVVCSVTAEDGTTTKEYTIQVKKVEGGETLSPDDIVEVPDTPTYTPGDMSATVNGVTYEVAKQFDESTLPEGFEAITTTYHDTEVRAGQGLQKDVILMYLTDADGNGSLYMYNESKDSFSPWVEISVSSKTIAILPMEEGVEIPVGFVEASIDVNVGEDQKKTVSGWVWESDEQHEYCVFYGMNWNGEKGLYRYDFKEMTLQRYFQDPAVDTGISREIYDQAVENYNSLVGDYNARMAVVLILVVAVVILLGIVITLSVKLAKKPKESGTSSRAERRARAPKEELDAFRDTQKQTTKQKQAETLEEEEERYEVDEVDELEDNVEEQEEQEPSFEEENRRVSAGQRRTDILGVERDLEDELAKDITEVKNSMEEEDDLEILDDLEEEESEEDDFDLLDLDDEPEKR